MQKLFITGASTVKIGQGREVLQKKIITKATAIKLSENQKVRTSWDREQEKCFFSIIDAISVLAQADRPRKYWNDLKSKLIKEGSELSEKIG